MSVTRALRLGPELSLPLDAVTQKLAFLGRTGSGKTYAAMKLAEEMLDADAQVVALDPVGIWWGLRLAAGGKGPGIPIAVLGGLHGDVPLEVTAGKLIADLVVDRGISAVLDVSQFESDAAKARFAGDFADRFFFRKKASPSAVHLFLEECQEFVPQNIMRGEERMLHAFTRLIKLGRNFGVGASLISQRPQEVNKKALNMTECLLAFQMTGPHERKTVEAWISEKGLDLDIVADLPKLPVGTAHVWSPAWLRVSKTVKVATKRTFDASSTPEVGKQAQARALAPIDLEQLRERMAETIERAKAEDPRELRKLLAERERKIKELEGGLALAVKTAATMEPKVERVEVPVVNPGVLRKLHESAAGLNVTVQSLVDALLRVERNGSAKFSNLDTSTTALPIGGYVHRSTPAPAVRHPAAHGTRGVQRSTPASSNGRTYADAVPPLTGGGLKRMLVALAQRPTGLSAVQLGTRAGLSSRSGTFDTYLGRARRSGWIEGERRLLRVTDEGLLALGSYDPLPTGLALAAHWIGEMGSGGAARMLSELVEAYPRGMTAAELGKAAGISDASGTFDTYLGRLRRLELIQGTRAELRASAEFFE